MPRWTRPATVKPEGPTETNWMCIRVRVEVRIMGKVRSYHARASGFAGKLLGHEAVDECAIDHKADKESSALDSDCAKSYGYGVDAGCGF